MRDTHCSQFLSDTYEHASGGVVVGKSNEHISRVDWREEKIGIALEKGEIVAFTRSQGKKAISFL